MTDFTQFYNQLAREIHDHNVKVGWWDDPKECIFQKLQLVSTEVAEATEGARKSLMDTHLEHRTMEEVEYADAMIRILDIGGKMDLRYLDEASVPAWCHHLGTIGMQHLGINYAIIDMGKALQDVQYQRTTALMAFRLLEHTYSSVIKAIVAVADHRDCELFTAIQEKRLYNEVRPDHKRENRAKPGGKGF